MTLHGPIVQECICNCCGDHLYVVTSHDSAINLALVSSVCISSACNFIEGNRSKVSLIYFLHLLSDTPASADAADCTNEISLFLSTSCCPLHHVLPAHNTKIQQIESSVWQSVYLVFSLPKHAVVISPLKMGGLMVILLASVLL